MYHVVTFLTEWGKSALNFVCNILIIGKIIKEMPRSVASGIPCIIPTTIKNSIRDLEIFHPALSNQSQGVPVFTLLLIILGA